MYNKNINSGFNHYANLQQEHIFWIQSLCKSTTNTYILDETDSFAKTATTSFGKSAAYKYKSSVLREMSGENIWNTGYLAK